MSYNTDGPAFGGFNFPMAIPCGNNNNSNDMFGWLMALLFFSLFGWGGMGGLGPGRGMPGPMCGTAMAGNAAAETAALIGQQATADRVAGIGADVRQILGQTGGLIEAVNTVGNRTQDGFASLNTHLCEGFNNVAQQFNSQTMQGMSLHNSTTALLNDMRAENARCCCESRFQGETSKSEILRAIEALGCRLEGRIDGLERAALQDKLAAAQAQAAELKAKLDNQNQTSEILAAMQRHSAPCPAPAPYPYGYPYGCTPCSPCSPCYPCTQLSEAIIQKGINGIVNPTTPAAAA